MFGNYGNIIKHCPSDTICFNCGKKGNISKQVQRSTHIVLATNQTLDWELVMLQNSFWDKVYPEIDLHLRRLRLNCTMDNFVNAQLNVGHRKTASPIL